MFVNIVAGVSEDEQVSFKLKFAITLRIVNVTVGYPESTRE